MAKELTAENKLQMVSLLANGFVNTRASKIVTQEVTNIQHCMIDNLITVNNSDEFYNMLYVFGIVCDMLEQQNMGSYRMIVMNNTLRLNIPKEAKIRLIEERNDLYCSIGKMTDKDKWEIAQCVRILIQLINYYELHTIEEK